MSEMRHRENFDPPKAEARTDSDNDPEKIRRQELERLGGYDLIPADEPSITYDPYPWSEAPRGSKSLHRHANDLPPEAAEILGAFPWGHVPPAGSGLRAAELPREFEQLITTIHERAKRNPHASEAKLLAATQEEGVRRRLIEASHWQQECDQAEAELEKLKPHHNDSWNQLREAKTESNSFEYKDQDTINAFETCRDGIAKADKAEQVLGRAQLERRHYLQLKDQRDRIEATRDELRNPAGLRKLSLLLPGRRAEKNAQLHETQIQIDHLTNDIRTKWDTNLPEASKIYRLEQKVSPLLEARPQLAEERNQLQPDYDQAMARLRRIEAAKQEYAANEEISSKLNDRVRTARTKIEAIKAKNYDLFEDVLGHPGTLGRVEGRDLYLRSHIGFDENGIPRCEAESLWDLPDNAPKGIKSAADYRRRCAEQLVKRGHSPQSVGEHAPRSLPEGHQFTDHDHRLGYDLVPIEPPSFEWQNQVTPELPQDIAVHCADLDSHGGYTHKLEAISSAYLRELSPHGEPDPEALERRNGLIAQVKEDCRRREIDRYQAIKQYHEAVRDHALNEQTELEAYGKRINLTAQLDRLDSGPMGQTVDEYRNLRHLGNEGRKLKQSAEVTQRQIEATKKELGELSQQYDQHREARQQLELTWRHNPLQKLGLARAGTKERSRQQQIAANQLLASTKSQQKTKAQEASGLDRRLKAIEGSPQLKNLPEITDKLAQLEPGYAKAQLKRSILVADRQVAHGREQIGRQQSLVASQRMKRALQAAEQIHQEIRAFSSSETTTRGDLISDRTKTGHLFYRNGEPVFINKWRGPDGERSADQYRRNQAAVARGLDPVTMTRRPGTSLLPNDTMALAA